MEKEASADSSSDLDPGIDVSEILNNLEFIFICHGVLLSIIVIVGVILNVMCLAVLFHRSFRSSPPYCLLQALTLGDLAILFLSVYSDICPAITSHLSVQSMVLPDEKLLDSLDSILNKRQVGSWNWTDTNRSQTPPTDAELELFLKTLLGPGVDFKVTKLRDVPIGTDSVDYDSYILANSSSNLPVTTQRYDSETTSVENVSPGVEINTKPIVKAVERFVAYFLMTYNLLIVTVFVVERCFVVVRPMKAKIFITVYRTRCVIFLVTSSCLVIHCPQLVREVVLACFEPSRLRDDFQGMLLQSFRRDYEMFLVYLTSFLLGIVLVGNVVLSILVVKQKRDLRQTLRSTAETAERKQNINVAFVLIFMTCCLLPPVIAANVLARLSMTSFKQHVSTFIKTWIVIRVLYISNSGFNCLFYCLIARRFKRVFLDVYCRPCRKPKPGGRTGFSCASSPELSSKTRVTVQASPSSSVSERLYGSLMLHSAPTTLLRSHS